MRPLSNSASPADWDEAIEMLRPRQPNKVFGNYRGPS